MFSLLHFRLFTLFNIFFLLSHFSVIAVNASVLFFCFSFISYSLCSCVYHRLPYPPFSTIPHFPVYECYLSFLFFRFCRISQKSSPSFMLLFSLFACLRSHLHLLFLSSIFTFIFRLAVFLLLLLFPFQCILLFDLILFLFTVLLFLCLLLVYHHCYRYYHQPPPALHPLPHLLLALLSPCSGTRWL